MRCTSGKILVCPLCLCRLQDKDGKRYCGYHRVFLHVFLENEKGEINPPNP